MLMKEGLRSCARLKVAMQHGQKHSIASRSSTFQILHECNTIKYQKWNHPCKCWTTVSYAIYVIHSSAQIYSQVWKLLSRFTQALFINASQQDGSWFWDPAGARVGSLRWRSGFLRQSKHMRVSLIGHSKLPVGVNVGVNACLSYMSALRWTGHLSSLYAAMWLQIMNVCSWVRFWGNGIYFMRLRYVTLLPDL